jgi:hypothetical protein
LKRALSQLAFLKTVPLRRLTVPSRDCLTWLREARKLLAAICGRQTGLITVTIHNEHGQGVEFLLPPDDHGRPVTHCVPTETRSELVQRRLRPVEEKALHAAEDTPLPVKALARKAGYRPGSYFSEAVTQLCRLGKLVRVPDGVRRAEEE